MKILYVSSVVNHHQAYFVKELYEIFPDNVWYAALETYEQRRKMMCFPEFEEKWIIDITKNRTLFNSLFIEADFVLCHDYNFYPQMKERLAKDKITFYFSERWFKPPYGKIRLLRPYMLKLWYEFYRMSKSPCFFYLSQGEYAAADFRTIGVCPMRMFNFGYVTSIQQNPTTEYLLPQGKINILWCGRMLAWKKVENLVQAFIRVSKIRSDIHLTLVGKGECEKKVLKLISCYEDVITHQDFLPTKKVRSLMNQADVYVLSSSGTEGWGVVVNEAMAEGCAIIGSNQAGSIKTMIKDKVNGLVLYRNDVDEIEEKLLYLIDNPIELKRLKYMSLDSIQEWSPENVCSRFVQVVDAINNNKLFDLYREGPFKSL